MTNYTCSEHSARKTTLPPLIHFFGGSESAPSSLSNIPAFLASDVIPRRPSFSVPVISLSLAPLVDRPSVSDSERSRWAVWAPSPTSFYFSPHEDFRSNFYVQGSAIRWALGCVSRLLAPSGRGARVHATGRFQLLSDPCMLPQKE